MANDNKKTRYSDSELEEFKEIIEKKLVEAREELEEYQNQILKKNSGASDTDYKFNGLEDSHILVEREYLSQQAGRQAKFINHLENALVRIQNKTYGICRKTGKLINKERLKAVPHATLSIEAKMSQND
ncbi:MAG: TraR/DksA C4-type zinc finger protein [Chitinophagales bacterium]|nr:TraR/DksA family transcriptional regulator [Bacteroidota bacterium]MCB9226094.1 TraR/DksA family transcriptional regulator [Chitinophagales bacterium]